MLSRLVAHECRLFCSNRHEGWCKHCSTLEKELTNALAGALEAKEKWVDENNWEDLNFKQIDQHFECRAIPFAKPESRKRKYDTLVSVKQSIPFPLCIVYFFTDQCSSTLFMGRLSHEAF